MCKHFCFSFISRFVRRASREYQVVSMIHSMPRARYPDRSGTDQRLGEINWRESNGPCNRYVSLSAYTLTPDPCYIWLSISEIGLKRFINMY